MLIRNPNLLATLKSLIEHIVEEDRLSRVSRLDIQALYQVLLHEGSANIELLVSFLISLLLVFRGPSFEVGWLLNLALHKSFL